MTDEATKPKRKKASKSPTQRSLAWCRDRELTAQVTERWNPFAKIRQDLFGFIDMVALGSGSILAIQATSTRVAERVDKIYAEPRARDWLESGGLIEVHGWSKRANGRYLLRRVRIYLDCGAMCHAEIEADEVRTKQAKGGA